MTLFPDVQKKAQAEVDRVTGGNRLPEFEDREQMPYVNALLKEVLRCVLSGRYITSRLPLYDGLV